MITITKVNEVFLKISAEKYILQELNNYFAFDVDGARFSPAFKQKLWNGKKHLFNGQTRTIYVGLYQHILEFAEKSGYTINENSYKPEKDNYSIETVEKFVKEIVKPASQGIPLETRDYQINGIHHCVSNKRATILSPTSSGKSLLIYSIVRFLLSSKKIKRALFIFPGTSLVEQMYKDFIDYSSINEWDVENRSHAIFSGQEKQTDKTLTFATYQSLAKMPISFFGQFDAVFVDECQTAKSKSIVDIMERCHNIEYRFGFSGTIPDGKAGKAHRLVIEGLFDKVFETISTDELIKRGQVTNLKIKSILLKYPDSIKKLFPKVKYPDEMKYLIENKQRNKFIVNLANNLTGNTLILFNFIEHGKTLLKLLEGRENVHFITGDNSVEEREHVRQIAESTDDCLIVATYGVFSTGINIRNLHNCIIASPTKSRIRLFQSLGRILRLSNGKTVCTLYDIGDDLSWKSNRNHTLKHFMERIKYYAEAKLKYKIIEHQLIKHLSL